MLFTKYTKYFLLTLYLLSKLEAICFISSQQRKMKIRAQINANPRKKYVLQKLFLFGFNFSFFFVQSLGIYVVTIRVEKDEKKEKNFIFSVNLSKVWLIFVFIMYSVFNRLNRTYFSIFRRALARSGVKNQFEKTFLWISFYLVQAFIFYLLFLQFSFNILFAFRILFSKWKHFLCLTEHFFLRLPSIFIYSAFFLIYIVEY